jgi:hypothetical protein
LTAALGIVTVTISATTANIVNYAVTTLSTGSVTIGSAPTAGSVLFIGSGGNVFQNNANLFWSNTSNSLGLGTTLPIANLAINGTLQVSGATTFNGAVNYSSASGVNNPKREIVLTPGGAALASTSPTQGLTILSSNEYTYLAYTRSTTDAAWMFTMPSEFDVNTNASATVLWQCSATSGAVMWNVAYTQYSTTTGNNLLLNAALINVSTTAVAATSAATNLNATVFTMSGMAPNLLTQIRLRRVGTDAADTLSDECHAIIIRIDYAAVK